jgi:hypothetical protein
MNDFREWNAVREKHAYSVAAAHTERREPARDMIGALVQFRV